MTHTPADLTDPDDEASIHVAVRPMVPGSIADDDFEVLRWSPSQGEWLVAVAWAPVEQLPAGQLPADAHEEVIDYTAPGGRR